MERSADPGTILDISVRKQRERSEDLYRRVLVNNTARAAQRSMPAMRSGEAPAARSSAASALAVAAAMRCFMAY